MKVENLMTRDVKTCRAGDCLATAAMTMWKYDCGAIPILDRNDQVLGMLTDRDICMAATMENMPPRDIPVTVPMSGQVWSCHPRDTLVSAEAVMKDNRVRRLPVIDADNRLVGILSLNDIVREAEREHETEEVRVEITDAEVRGTMAAVGQPHLRRTG